MMRLLKSLLALSLLFASASPAQVDPVARGIAIQALNKANSISGSSGTVTSVSVTTANGVSGTVANPTTTPAISVTLGAITPSSVASSGAVSGTTVTGTGLGTFAGVKSSTGSFYRDDGSQILSASSGDTFTRFYAPGSGIFFFLNSAQNVTDFQIDNSGNTVAAGTVSGTNLTTGGLPASIATDTIIGRSAAGTGAASALTVLPTADMPALTGDVTNSAGSLGTTIAANAVTYAKMQQVAASSLVGNPTGSLANAQGITLGSSLAFSASALQRAALTGDVTASQDSNATTIANGVVTVGKMATIAANTVLGNGTGSTAAVTALTTIPTATLPAMTGGDVTSSAGSTTLAIGAGKVTTTQMANLAASSLLGNPTGSPAAPSAITLAGGLGFSGTTLTAAGALTPTSVASTGAISGTTVAASSSILSSGATNGIGYSTGAGGTATQGTSRVTGVTINKACGAITIFSAAGVATYNTFTVTDSAVAATDTIIINQKSGTNLYIILITSIGAGTFNVSFATTGGTATDAPVFNYCAIKGVAA